MTNTIRFLNKGNVMLTHGGTTYMLKEVKSINDKKVWYKINGKYYA